MSNSESGKEDGKAMSGRNSTVKELIDMFERLCQNVEQDQGLRDAISKVVEAQPASMPQASDLLKVDAAVVADVLQKLKVSSEPENKQQRSEQQQTEQQHGEEQLSQSLKSLSHRICSSALQSLVATTTSAEQLVSVAESQIRNTRFMSDTGLTHTDFCQQLNELLKLHLLIQRFVRDSPTNDDDASTSNKKT